MVTDKVEKTKTTPKNGKIAPKSGAVTPKSEVKKDKPLNPNLPFGFFDDCIRKQLDVIIEHKDAGTQIKEVKCKIVGYDNYTIVAIENGKRTLFFKSEIVKIKEL